MDGKLHVITAGIRCLFYVTSYEHNSFTSKYWQITGTGSEDGDCKTSRLQCESMIIQFNNAWKMSPNRIFFVEAVGWGVGVGGGGGGGGWGWGGGGGGWGAHTHIDIYIFHFLWFLDTASLYPSIKHNQYHVFYCPGYVSSQGISRFDTDHLLMEYSCFSTRMIGRSYIFPV